MSISLRTLLALIRTTIWKIPKNIMRSPRRNITMLATSAGNMKMRIPRMMSTRVLVIMRASPPFCLLTIPNTRDTRPEAIRNAARIFTITTRDDPGKDTIITPRTMATTALSSPPVLLLKPNVIISENNILTCEVNNYSSIIVTFATCIQSTAK